MKYVLEMNEEQAGIVQKALEFYARMRMGQFSELPRICIDPKDEQYFDKIEYTKPLLELARRACYPELMHTFNHSYGVGEFKDADLAWETCHSIRHCVAWAKHPEGGSTVDFGKPMSLRGNKIAKCTAVKDDDEEFIEK